MTAYISLSTLVKTTVSAITLLTCYNSAFVPPVPIKTAYNTQLEAGWKKTCYADPLTESQASEVSEGSESLEVAADKLAAIGKYKEAIQKYNEAGAAVLNEAIADRRAENMEDTVIRHSRDVEDFREKNRALVEKSAESNFKIGRSYMQLGKF